MSQNSTTIVLSSTANKVAEGDLPTVDRVVREGKHFGREVEYVKMSGDFFIVNRSRGRKPWINTNKPIRSQRKGSLAYVEPETALVAA